MKTQCVGIACLAGATELDSSQACGPADPMEESVLFQHVVDVHIGLTLIVDYLACVTGQNFVVDRP